MILFFVFPLLSLQIKVNAEATFLIFGSCSLLLDIQVKKSKIDFPCEARFSQPSA